MPKQPNLIFVFADQWRAQATGYAGDPNVKTPNLDRFAEESTNLRTAVAGCPVCSPWRASLMTGQYPLTHGVFVNDVPIGSRPVFLAEAFNTAGYDTAYVGKWHIAGYSRSAFVPQSQRLGFQFWRGYECTHSYNESYYYGDTPERLKWEGYDAFAQTREAQSYLRQHNGERPFALFLSWGPPHNPFGTAPPEYEAMYRPEDIILRDNVPADTADRARQELAGYYAHCSALDDSFGQLLQTIDECGLAEDSIVIFTSDHGDMLGAQGKFRKQKPWDESIHVPFLLRYPSEFGRAARQYDAPIDAPDLMPTLLGLCGIGVPDTVEGSDFSAAIRAGEGDPDEAARIGLYACFHEWRLGRDDAREWRGLRTARYTFIADANGPWLLYDNQEDPCQLHNLVDVPEHRELCDALAANLRQRLEAAGDEFLTGAAYLAQWGYATDEHGEVPVVP